MTGVSEAKLQDMLRKVQAMLARADHPNTPPAEAETSRRMAGELMEKYRIDEAMFEGAKPIGQQMTPQWSSWLIHGHTTLYSDTYRSMASAVIEHFELRGVFHHTEQGWVIKAVGYESDLRMAEAMYTSAMLAFQQRVEPQVDPTQADSVNAYNLRKAGMEGWRVADAIYGQGAGQDKSKRSKVRKMFKDEAIRRGENPDELLGNTGVKGFRESYARAFVGEFWMRLNRMRRMRGEMSAGLVIMDRVHNVNEAFYEKYPDYRPKSGDLGRYVDPRQGCPKCEKAASGYCRDHAYLKPSKARVKQTATNYAAAARGRDAARTVDIGSTPEERRLDG